MYLGTPCDLKCLPSLILRDVCPPSSFGLTALFRFLSIPSPNTFDLGQKTDHQYLLNYSEVKSKEKTSY